MSLLTSASSLSRSGSLPLPEFSAPAAAPRAVRSRQTAARPARRPARSLVCSAHHEQDRAAAALATVKSSCSKFLGRYDPVTTGVGSLLVTGYCVVVHEQPVGEALNIAVAATVLGMVMQEMIFHNDDKHENQA